MSEQDNNGKKDTGFFEPTPAPEKSSGNKGAVPLWIVCLAVGAAAALYIKDGLHPAEETVSRVVVLDSGALIRAKASQAMTLSQGDPAAIAKDAALFATQLKGLTQEYATGGYIILNSMGTVQWPESADITKSVADKLGVNLALANTPATFPAAQVAAPAAAPAAQSDPAAPPAN